MDANLGLSIFPAFACLTAFHKSIAASSSFAVHPSANSHQPG